MNRLIKIEQTVLYWTGRKLNIEMTSPKSENDPEKNKCLTFVPPHPRYLVVHANMLHR